MKVIVDAEFPPLNDPRCLAMRMELYKRKRTYNYKELANGNIYIYFPRINPFRYIYQHIKYYIWSKHHKEDDNN